VLPEAGAAFGTTFASSGGVPLRAQPAAIARTPRTSVSVAVQRSITFFIPGIPVDATFRLRWNEPEPEGPRTVNPPAA
jgi:hypothetical protein